MPASKPVQCRVVAALSAVALCAVAAGPADKNTTEYIVPAVKARFRVPKAWVKKDVTGQHADALYVFDPAPKTKPSTVMKQQLVEVYLNTATDAQKTLEAAVADFKAAQLKRKPTLKFIKDAATTFAGRKVWQLHWNERLELKTLDGKKAGFADLDRYSYLWLEHDALCQIGLHADTQLMPTLIQKAEPVAKSIVWDD